MMKHPRLLSLLIALVLCLFVGAAGAEVTSTTTTYTVDAEALGLPSNDELFAYYVEQKLYGYEWATFNRAVDQLSERQQKLYAHLEAALEKIATGQTASTVVVVDAATLSACGYSATGSISTQEEYNAAAEQFSTEIDADFDVVNAALVIDHPFEMYWYDKQTQLRCSFPLKNGNELDFSATFTFYPVENFQPASGYDEEAPTVDTAKTSAATSATTKAQKIVAKYASVSDYEKIIGYMDEICALTSYNDAAAETVKNGTDYGSNSPWQLLWVFDGDTSTEVVCEGYAKAFQYLCDLTTFDSALVESRIVTGNLSEGIGAGPHMWNVVTMDDGYNYIVDVTNTDGNSVGNQGQFKLGGTSNYQTNYDPTPDTADNWGDTYAFYCNAQQTMYFTYDSDMTSVYTPADLALAPYNYADVAYITAADGTITGYADIEDAVSAWGNGTTLTLLENCTVDEKISVSAYTKKTLNLNEFTLTCSVTYDAALINYGELIISGGTLSGYHGIDNASTGILTLQNCNIIGTYKYSYGIQNSGTMTATGTTSIVGSQYNIKYVSGSIDLSGIPAATATGWTIKNSGSTTADSYITLPEGLSLSTTLTSGTTATITTPVATTYVAEVDGTKYAEFSTALNAWKASGSKKLTLLDDVQIISGIKLDTYNGDKVLDLNGHQLSRTDGSIVLYITNGSINLTIQDSDSNGKIVATADKANLIDNSGTLTITGGTFEAGNGIAIANYGKLNISGNTVISNNSENFVCVAYPTSISGNVQINGTVDISFKKIPDLKTATNCKGWVVTNSGDAPTMLYADEWLPNGYALEINGKIDYDLDESATGTIVEHSTCTENDWGNDEKSHWKKCDCGRTLIYGLHTMELVDNGDGTHSLICTAGCGYPEPEDRVTSPHDYTASYASIDGTTHTAACACGATVTEPHTLGYTSAGNGKHDVTCTKSCGYSATAVTCTNVTCTPVTETTTSFRHTVYCNDCKNEYTEGCNAGTCPKCGAHGVIVDNKRLTTANAGDVLGDHTVSYDAATRTLSLNEANTTYVYSNHKLTVAYSGENTLSQHIGAPKLVLNAASGAKLNAASIGGSLSVEVEINGGTVNLSGADKNPIDAGNLTINNAIVVAHNSSSPVPTIDLAGKLTLDGNSHLTSTRGTNGYAVASDGIEGNGYYRTAANGAFTRFEEITGNVYIENYYEYVGAEHLVGKFVDDKNGATHSATCACGTTVTEPHTYADNVCTGCGVSNTVTITFNRYGDSGAKIVEINGKAVEISNGGTFTVPHGQELTVKFENTLSTQETGVYCDGYVIIDQTSIMCDYDAAANTLTIPGIEVTGDLDIDAYAYVRVQFNLHGGALTDDGRELLVEDFGYTWDAKTSTLKAGYSFNFALRPEYFQLDGHTLAGAMVVGSDKVVTSLYITGDMTVDILWECDGTAILTPVEAKAATCQEEGNIAHYKCTCSKLYANENGTNELTEDEVKTDIDSSNHVGMDPATGKCACGEMLAVAKVEFEGTTTYYETLEDLEDGCYGTLTLLADCSYDGLAIQFRAQENVINLNGHTLESERYLTGANGTLTITDPGTVKGAGITGGVDFEKLIIGENVNLEGTNGYELLFQCGTFDLTQATIPENGWRIRARNSGDGYGMDPTTFGFDNDCNVKLPDGYAAFNTEGNVVAEAAYDTIVTIKAHTHEYVNGVCGCGVICDHVGMDPDTGLCPVCKLQHVASVTIGSETTYYKTLYDALTAANEKTATVKLLTEVTNAYSFTFIFPSNVTLDMNGQTLTMGAQLIIYPGASLTITGDGTYNRDGGNNLAAFKVHSGGTLTIVNGTFEAIPEGCYVFESSGTLNIQGGTFIANADYNSRPLVLTDSSVVTVSGTPVFKGPEDWENYTGKIHYGSEFAIYDSAKLDLSNVTGSMDGWRVKNGSVQDGVTVGQNLILPASGYALKVGDEFVTTLATKEIGTIVAHTHNYTAEDYDTTHHWTVCACGATTEKVEHTFTYTPVEDEEVHIVGCSGCTYTAPEEIPHEFTNGVCVCTAEAVAKVEDTLYANFANAVAAWTDGTTLTLLADVTHDSSISLEEGTTRTFVGGDYTLDMGDDYDFITIEGALTIQSGTIKTTNYVLFVHGGTLTVDSNNTVLQGMNAPILVYEPEGLTITGTGCDGWKIWNNHASKEAPITIPEGFHLEDKDGNQLAANNKLLCRATTVIKADHNHNWSYQADGATITAICDADGCPDAEQSVTVEAPANLIYDGTSKDAAVSGSIDGADVTITYNDVDRVNVTGQDIVASITLGGATASVKYQVTPFSLTQTQIGYIADQPYTGAAIEPEISVTWADITLEKGTDYTVAYSANVDVGEVTVTATGKGNYTGETKAAFNITPASIADATIPAIADQPYTGEEIKPAVTVTMGNKTLAEGTDYDVTYSNNVNVGEATVTFTGKGNYTDEKTTTFKITPADAVVSVNTYLDDEAKSDFIYGQTITVKGQVAVASTTLSLRAKPTPNQVALYYNEVQISEPVTIGENGAYTLTYDTTDKAITPGSGIKLVVQYVGDNTTNMASAAGEVSITLAAKPLSVTGATATSRTYDGTDKVAIADVALDGIIEGDTVSVNVDGLKGTISSANAGEYTSIALPDALTLIGDHAAFYTAAGTEVVSTVTISAKVVTVTDLTIELTPATFVYDGNAKKPAVTVKDGDTIIPATEYTVSYQNNTEVGDATVNIADAEGGNYTVSGSATFEITKGNSDLTAATYLNDVATTDFTYGDVITVKGQATLQQTFALRQVEINKAALFCGDVQLGEPVAVGEGGTYTLTYDTTGKGLAIGENTLTLVYGGSGNLAGQTATVKVTLNKADPEVNIPADLTATYGDLLADVTLTSEPDNTAGTWAWNDPTAPVGDAGTQTHKATFTPSDTDYYNTAEVDVSITVGKLALTGVTLPENMTLPTYCATADEAKAQLPETVAYTGTDSKTYALPATWSCTDYNAAPDSESTFTWTVAAEQANFTFADGVATSGTITVKNGTAVAVTITGTDAAITYDGNPYDVSAMFTIDQNAGAATYSIVSNGTDTGAGTLEGSVLTITKAGTITIQVNTAANTVEGMPYAPGEATAVLTVSKGTLNVTAPTGLTASYGDTLASVKLPADANGTWAWKDTSTETKVGDAGERTHKAIFTPTNTDLWEAVEVDVTITVTKAAIILDGVVKSYLVTAEGETETTEFTYGQTITVRATPVMPAVLNARMIVAPEPNQMALFIGSTQISAPADADTNGVYTMTYETTDKALAIGTSDILVKYIGTDNHESGILPLTVTLLPAELKVSSVTLKDRTYEPGNTQVEVTAATLSGILDDDEVLADTAKMLCILKADGAMSDKAGSYTEVILPETIPLTGAHASFYTAKGGTAINATVTITKATPEATGTPDMGDVTPGTQLKDVPTDAIEELYKPVEGTVTWENPEETVEPGKEYDYTFTPNDQENYEPVEGSTVIIPLAPPQPEVPPVVLPTVIVPAEDQLVTVYEGETADMSVTAINADAYQWYINRNDGMGWRPIIGANTPAYTTSVTTLNDDGCLYLCRVSNADGAVNSPVFTLDVLPALDVPPTGDNTPVMLWASLLLMSAALMIMAGKKRRFN